MDRARVAKEGHLDRDQSLASVSIEHETDEGDPEAVIEKRNGDTEAETRRPRDRET